MGQDQQIENVARAFYGVENDEQSWDMAPNDLKNQFRMLACDAILLVPTYNDEVTLSNLSMVSASLELSTSASVG